MRSCGKRGREVGTIKPIDRNRKTIRTARTTFAAVVGQFLAHQAPHVAAQITSARAEVQAEAAKLAKAATDPADAVLARLDFSDWDALVTQLRELYIATAVDGVSVGFGQIGVDPSIDITDQANERAIAWAEARAAELVGMQRTAEGQLVAHPDPRWAITDSTREMLRGDVRDALETGISTTDLTAQLEAAYAFSEERADTIARTELARADVAGNMDAYRSSGVVEGKEWMLGSEHEDEDECDDAAAMGVVPLDSDFGGIGDPPAHPRCVCDVMPVLADEAE